VEGGEETEKGITMRMAQNTTLHSLCNLAMMMHYKAQNSYLITAIVLAVAMQLRHFRRENPTPILNPPMEWAASMSANIRDTSPFARTHWS